MRNLRRKYLPSFDASSSIVLPPLLCKSSMRCHGASFLETTFADNLFELSLRCFQRNLLFSGMMATASEASVAESVDDGDDEGDDDKLAHDLIAETSPVLGARLIDRDRDWVIGVPESFRNSGDSSI